MKTFLKSNRWFVLAITVLALVGIVTLPSCSKVEAQTTSTLYHWAPPISGPGVGMPAEKYRVEVRLNNGSWALAATVADTTYLALVPYDTVFELRVAGVDALDRLGLYSDASDPYTIITPPPREPGKPVHN